VAGHAVLTERVDRLQVQGKPVEIKVMGTFELNEAGKITAWRDYFDLGQLMSQIG
jgi:limonene-1,2-epoxide hydrolase